jgi:hypothetical protein
VYREIYGYESPTDAIGPEPSRVSPEARADWHAALAALGRIDGIDLRGCSDSQLRLRRSTYQQETAWAPPYVAEDLRLARLQLRNAHENIIREDRERRVAADPGAAARHEQLSAAWRDMQRTARTIVDTLAEAQETRRQWVILTEPTRQVAVAADQELRRRHPGQDPEQSLWDSDRARGVVEDPTRPARSGAVPGTVGEGPWDDISQRISCLSRNARVAQTKLDELSGMRMPGEDADAPHLGPAWTMFSGRDGAIVQLARPGITPASEVIRQAEDRRVAAIPEAENA